MLILSAYIMISKLKTEKQKIVLAHNSIQSESDLLRTRLEIQEHALNTIYNEIHDNIGQMLSSVHMKLVTLGSSAGNKLESGKLSELAGYMGRSIAELRNLGHALNGSTLEKTGLIDAIEKEIAFASSVNHLSCIFTCEDELPELTNIQEIILFRIVQGMIAYMFGYCKESNHVKLQITYDERETLTVKISDKQTGVLSQADLRDSLPQSIGERIKLMKGIVFITNQTGAGTVLTFTCNLKHGHKI